MVLLIVAAICLIVFIYLAVRFILFLRTLSMPDAIIVVIVAAFTISVAGIYGYIHTIGSIETFTGSGVVEKTYIETATYCGNRSPNAARRYFHTILQYGEIYCDVDSEEIYRTLEDAKGKTVDLEIRKDTLKNGDHKYYVLSVNGIECFGEQIEKEDIP